MNNIKIKTYSDYRLTVLRTIDEIESIRSIWQQMQILQQNPVINADIDRYISVIESLQDNNVNPYVMLLTKDNKPACMVIGRLEKSPIKCRFGYKTILKFNMRCLNIIYGGILGRLDEETTSILYHELINITRYGVADVIVINHLKSKSPLCRRLKEKTNFLCRGHFPKTERHWTMSIPDSIERFYESCSKKHRKHLKQYQRKLDKDFSDNIEYKIYTSDDDIEQAINEAIEISEKTYQHAIGSGFNNIKHKEKLIQDAAAKGWMMACILKLKGKPIAFRFGLKYGDTLFCDGTGYDPEFRKYRIGTILFLKVLVQLCKNRQIEKIDFGFGDAEYKRNYGDNSWTETTYYIFAPRPFPMTVNAVCGIFAGISNLGSYVLKKLNSGDLMKKKWRNRLRSKNTILSESRNI